MSVFWEAGPRPLSRMSACSVAQNVIKALQITAQARIRARGSNNQNTREIPRAWRDIARARACRLSKYAGWRGGMTEFKVRHSLFRRMPYGANNPDIYFWTLFIYLKEGSPVAVGFWIDRRKWSDTKQIGILLDFSWLKLISGEYPISTRFWNNFD